MQRVKRSLQDKLVCKSCQHKPKCHYRQNATFKYCPNYTQVIQFSLASKSKQVAYIQSECALLVDVLHITEMQYTLSLSETKKDKGLLKFVSFRLWYSKGIHENSHITVLKLPFFD